MSLESRNAALVVEALDAVMVRRDPDAVDRYFAEPYLQHNPQVPSGLEALRGLVAGIAQSPTFRYERFRVVADGDLVAVHGRYTGWQPEPLIALDLFRVEDGRIVEHWDGLQPEAGPNPSGHTMVDGPTAISGREHTDANRALVRSFVEGVLVNGDMSLLPERISTTTYVQHNPQVADGLDGLGAFVASLAEQGLSFRYHRLHRIVAEGDFVVTQSEGELGGEHLVFYDLFRVADGRIVEHWDVIQPRVETTASGLGQL
ncbi:MAG: nuclear transport factor 2 family protein [Sandaracinus sp.]|nr:nuclear transport factor 2 family protein [Sandaracinus sp.]MCB9622593.1 nuclear transport factor 2 family protein [Sandaracinus sp.]MCB9635615.1 nuclear transport factor 2 family protein [Sandaracinus sp.]